MTDQVVPVNDDDYMVKRRLMAEIEDQKRDIAQTDTSHRIVLWIVYLVIAGIIFFVGLSAFWLLWPYRTVEKTQSPLPIVKGYETVRQGGVVAYEYDYVKYSNVQPTVNREFVDGLIFESSDASTHLGPRVGHVRVEVPIPYTLPPGHYRLKIYISFQMNPWRTIQNVDTTGQFTVLANPHPDAAEDRARETSFTTQ